MINKIVKLYSFKFMLLSLLIVSLLCLHVNNVHALEVQNIAEFRFVDTDGVEIKDIDCQFYMYDSNGNIIEIGKAIKNEYGAYYLNNSMIDFNKIGDSDYVHFNLKAFATGKRLISYNWSEKRSNLENRFSILSIDKQSINKAKELTMINLNQVKTSSAIASLGSGIFRNRITYKGYFNKNVKVGELHFVENLFAKFSYETTSSSTITSSIKYSGGSWTANIGSTVECKGTVSGSLDNSGLANSCYMLAPHRFVKESWVREEEDTDIPGVWHVVESWQEAKAVSYSGGVVPGEAVAGYDGQTPQGTTVELKKGADRKERMSGSVTYTAGWTYGGASMQNKVAYGSSSEIFHRNDDALGVEYTVFKPDAGRDIWYATRTK